MDPEMQLYSEFLSYCLQSPNSHSLQELHQDFCLENSIQFNLHDFFIWKKKVESLVIIDNFKSYPFLRDECFLRSLRHLENDGLEIESIIQGLQLKYYSSEIDCKLTPGMMTLDQNSSASRCPFARLQPSSTSFIINENLTFIKETTLFSGIKLKHHRDNRFIAISSENGVYHIVLNGVTVISESTFENALVFLCDGARIIPSKDLVTNHSRKLLEAVLALTSGSLSVEDFLFFYPFYRSKVGSVSSDAKELNIFIHKIIYSLIAGRHPFQESAFIKPSRFEPYEDILTPEFLSENYDLFIQVLNKIE